MHVYSGYGIYRTVVQYGSSIKIGEKRKIIQQALHCSSKAVGGFCHDLKLKKAEGGINDLLRISGT